MMPDWIRVSDEERESTVRLLREAYAAGRLDRAELEERTAAAYTATTWGDLQPLTADLPAPPLWMTDCTAASVASAQARRRAGAAATARNRGRLRGLLLTVTIAGLIIAGVCTVPGIAVLGLLLALCALGASSRPPRRR